MAQTYIREDQAFMQVQVQDASGNWIDVGLGNSWYSYAGGAVTAAGAKTRPGGMGYEIELGGPGTRGDVTMEIQNSPGMVGQHPWLETRIGKGLGRVILMYLDDEGNTIPSAQFRITGKVKSAELPGQNATNAAAGMYKLMLGADQKAG